MSVNRKDVRVLHLLMLILFIRCIPATAQDTVRHVSVTTGKTYTFRRNDDSRFSGKVLNQDEKEIMIDAFADGIITVPKARIKEATERTAEEVRGTGQFVYADLGMGTGNHFTFKLLLDVLSSHDHVVSAGYLFSSCRDPQRPSDYRPGFLEFYPRIKLSMFGIMYGNAFHAKHSHQRYILKGGLALGTAFIPGEYIASGGFLSSNYTYSIRQQFTGGILLNPAIELPMSTSFGLQFDLLANINPVSTVIAVEMSMQFGKLRNRSKPRSISNQ